MSITEEQIHDIAHYAQSYFGYLHPMVSTARLSRVGEPIISSDGDNPP